MSLENITVNGVPLKQFVAVAITNEIQSVAKTENRFRKNPVASNSRVRNHSGARSGRCRIIYSKEVR